MLEMALLTQSRPRSVFGIGDKVRRSGVRWLALSGKKTVIILSRRKLLQQRKCPIETCCVATDLQSQTGIAQVDW
jgi:hypothetical protein